MRNAPLLILLVLPALASADDGFLTNGGTPHLLSKHPTVRMVRERVVVTIRPSGYHVDATFVFRNEGRARTVRMGFPDRGEGGEGTVYGEDTEDSKSTGKKMKPYSGLDHFRSWVDGKPVPTALIPDGEGAQSWHTKTIAFRRHATRWVRVSYDADGGGATNTPSTYVHEASYILHTGASWKGQIGYAQVVVRFPKGSPPIRAVSLRRLKLHDAFEIANWNRRPKGTVVWSGFARPSVHGRELCFSRWNFEPRAASDIDVCFAPYLSK